MKKKTTNELLEEISKKLDIIIEKDFTCRGEQLKFVPMPPYNNTPPQRHY